MSYKNTIIEDFFPRNFYKRSVRVGTTLILNLSGKVGSIENYSNELSANFLFVLGQTETSTASYFKNKKERLGGRIFKAPFLSYSKNKKVPKVPKSQENTQIYKPGLWNHTYLTFE